MGSDRQRHALNKYLAGYSEKEASQLNKLPTTYAHTLVIPLYDEAFDVIYRLLNTDFSSTNSSSYQHVLFILVVNCPEGGDDLAATRTTHLLEQLLAWIRPVYNNKNVTFGEIENGCGVILVDRCTTGRQIPKHQGVGLARKIGADIACYLMAEDAVKSRWIHSTDADVMLPVNYFSRDHTDSTAVPEDSELRKKPQVKPIALVYPFKHVPEAGYEIASALYDWSLRYYVESIKSAGSNYAYHTIGSLIAVDFEAYAKVRGFPKRSGGEDFYLLNKLAKVGKISSLQTPVINITARPSQRVPFGTGPAICKITENKQAIETHTFYHPDIFRQLKAMYTVINESWIVRGNQTLGSSMDILAAIKLSDKELITVIDSVNRQTIDAIEALGFVGAWKHAVMQSSTQAQFIKQMTVWFDAFKTLKFVHYLRDHGYPSLIMKDLLNEAQMLSDELRMRGVKLLSMSAA